MYLDTQISTETTPIQYYSLHGSDGQRNHTMTIRGPNQDQCFNRLRTGTGCLRSVQNILRIVLAMLVFGRPGRMSLDARPLSAGPQAMNARSGGAPVYRFASLHAALDRAGRLELQACTEVH